MTDPRDAVGRERVQEAVVAPFPAHGMAALLDRDPSVLREGSPLPAGWHWLYFHAPARRSELGADGHERPGAFLPAAPLPRRMWAGGRIAFPGALRLGERAVRRSAVERVEEKAGRSGRLLFVTVRHRIETARGPAVDEAQDLVYREARPGAAVAVSAPAPPGAPAWSEEAVADPVTLFRFSALTFNGHRIHYDHPYATGEEGYPGVVVHGPLLALLLLDAATRRAGPGRPPARFTYRAVSPLFAGEPFRLEGGEPGDARDEPGSAESAAPAGQGETGEERADLWVAGPRGIAMRASAAWG